MFLYGKTGAAPGDTVNRLLLGAQDGVDHWLCSRVEMPPAGTFTHYMTDWPFVYALSHSESD